MASLVVDVSSHRNLGSSFSKIRVVNWLISLPRFSVTRTTFQDEIPWGWLVRLGFPELWWDQCGVEAREKVGSCCSCESGLTFQGYLRGRLSGVTVRLWHMGIGCVLPPRSSQAWTVRNNDNGGQWEPRVTEYPSCLARHWAQSLTCIISVCPGLLLPFLFC